LRRSTFIVPLLWQQQGMHFSYPAVFFLFIPHLLDFLVGSMTVKSLLICCSTSVRRKR
jgi:hypothetical protein